MRQGAEGLTHKLAREVDKMRTRVKVVESGLAKKRRNLIEASHSNKNSSISE
jgi:hypothetical protein